MNQATRSIKNVLVVSLLVFGIQSAIFAAPKPQTSTQQQPIFQMTQAQQVVYNSLSSQEKANFQKMSQTQKASYLKTLLVNKAAQEKKEKTKVSADNDKDAKSKKAAPKAAQKTFGPECRMLYWDDIKKDLVGSKDNAGTCHHPNEDAAAKGKKGNCATKLSYLHCPNKKSSSSAKAMADKDKKPATQKTMTTTSNAK